MSKNLLISYLFIIISSWSYSQNQSFGNESHLKIDGEEIFVPANTLTFAKKATHSFSIEHDTLSSNFDINNILGPPKFNSLIQENGYFPIGCEEYLIVEFGSKNIKNLQNSSIYLFGQNLSGNNLISISKNGKTWLEVGSISIDQQSIDLNNSLLNGEKFKYLKVQNTNDCGLENCQHLMIEAIAIRSTAGDQPIDYQEIKSRKIFTTNDQVTLKIKDVRYFDGDVITIYHNGKVIANKKLLTKQDRSYQIKLCEGENRIKLYTKRDGIIKDSTIKLKIVDGKTIHEAIYRLKKKKSTTIKILRG